MHCVGWGTQSGPFTSLPGARFVSVHSVLLHQGRVDSWGSLQSLLSVLHTCKAFQGTRGFWKFIKARHDYLVSRISCEISGRSGACSHQHSNFKLAVMLACPNHLLLSLLFFSTVSVGFSALQPKPSQPPSAADLSGSGLALPCVVELQPHRA